MSVRSIGMMYLNKFKLYIIRTVFILFVLLTVVFIVYNVKQSYKLPRESSISSVDNLQELDINYQEIIKSYQEFALYIIDRDIEAVFQDDVFTLPNIDETLLYYWENMLIETSIWSYRDFLKDKDAFGFALTDLNHDGVDELILLLKDYTTLAIFTIVNNEIKLIDAYWSKHRCAIYDTGILYTLTSSGASQWYYRTQYISPENGELQLLQEYGNSNDKYYKINDGEKCVISENEFMEFQKVYPVLSYATANNITEKSGIEFRLLFADFY